MTYITYLDLTMNFTDKIQNAVDILRHARRFVALTGAGASKESGVPTFRDALDGLWAKYDPMKLATPAAFTADPSLVWEFYQYRRTLMRPAQPNKGHLALAALEKYFGAFPVITQNIDQLHETANSTNVIHLHGLISRNKCFADCQHNGTLIDLETLQDKDASPPRCPHCGAYIRPDVVWFNEMLPADALQAASQALSNCDVMLIIGTSGVVHPAAAMPLIAKQNGATLIEINPQPSEITRHVDLFIPAASGEALPQIITLLGSHD